jgi:hypothetical protein
MRPYLGSFRKDVSSAARPFGVEGVIVITVPTPCWCWRSSMLSG